jgi:hypothetical protein
VILQLVEGVVSTCSAPWVHLLDTEYLKTAAEVKVPLSHTTGIASWEDIPEWIMASRVTLLDLKKAWKKTEAFDYIVNPVQSGLLLANCSYLQANCTLFGLVTEKITKETAKLEIQERVIDPPTSPSTHR